MTTKTLQTMNEMPYHTRCSFFSQIIGLTKFFRSFWKKSPYLQLLLVDVMYPFLFCFCFWLPPFIAFNTELVYNVKTIMLLCHFYQGRIEMTVMGCGCLLVVSLSLVFWTINKLVRAADQDRRSKRFCSNALRTFHLTEPGSGPRNRNVEVMELRFVHSIHS